MLAVLIGTALAGIVPAAIAAQNTSQDGSLTNVLRVDLSSGQVCKAGCTAVTGLAPAQATDLLERIATISGTTTLTAYARPGVPTGRFSGPYDVVNCADLRQWPVLGHCPAGSTAVSFNTGVLDTDNIAALNKNLPLITSASATSTLDTHAAKLNLVLIKVVNATTLERVRTTIADTGLSVQAPTFGEVASVRSELYLEIQRLVTVIATVTLLVAGVSLTVSVGGSLIERKRPFTLLQLSGTGIATLYRVVLQETVVPLVAATLLAVAIGFALARPVARTLAPQRHAWAVPEPSFYLTTGIALVSALGVILACLPLLARITDTEQVRFE